MIERPEERNWFEAHRFLTLTSTIVLGIVLILGTGEIVARVMIPQWAPARADRSTFFAYDELLGWSMRANQHSRFASVDFAVDVAINSDRLRDDEYPIERTEKKRMLVLGDSFAWGFGVEKEERFSEFLERRHADWEIINAAVSGYGTDQEYLYYEERGCKYRPDVLLVLFDPNDFENDASGEQYWYYKPFFEVGSQGLLLRNTPVPPSSIHQRLDRFFLGETYFLAKLYNALLFARYHLPSLVQGGRRAPQQNLEHRHSDSERTIERGDAVTAAILAALSQLARHNGARLVLISMPMSESQRQALRSLSAAEAFPYFELDDAFTGSDGQATFRHDEHWNARGHQIAGAAIEHFLQTVGVF